MNIILSYSDVLSRVQINVTGIASTATSVTIERSTNQVTWDTVRGGSALAPSANAVTLDDYEFSANVPNYYRVRSYDTAASTYVTGAPAVTGNNTSLVPPMPAGMQAGDLVLIQTSIRYLGFADPVLPAGYTMIVNAANMKLFGKIVTGASEPSPTITFTGGIANMDTIAQAAAFRRTSITPGAHVEQLNQVSPAEQNIRMPALTIAENRMVVLALYWKFGAWTSVTPPPGFTAIMGNGGVSTVGDDASQGWSYQIQTNKANIPQNTTVVTGGSAADSWGVMLSLYHTDMLLDDLTSSITPTITGTWFKDISKPFLNRQVHCVPAPSPIMRRARQGIFPIVGRSNPIAVTDLRGSREYTLRAVTRTTDDYQAFDVMLSTGDVLFIQSPPTSAIPTIYAAIDTTQQSKPLQQVHCQDDWRTFDLPLIEVAAPSADVVGSVGTWQTVVNTYATWSDVLAHHATWSSLLTLVGSTNDVIVS